MEISKKHLGPVALRALNEFQKERRVVVKDLAMQRMELTAGQLAVTGRQTFVN